MTRRGFFGLIGTAVLGDGKRITTPRETVARAYWQSGHVFYELRFNEPQNRYDLIPVSAAFARAEYHAVVFG